LEAAEFVEWSDSGQSTLELALEAWRLPNIASRPWLAKMLLDWIGSVAHNPSPWSEAIEALAERLSEECVRVSLIPKT
jgi:hypothetical protein